MKIIISVLFSFIFCFSKGQTTTAIVIKHKADSILKSLVGNGIKRTVLKFKNGYKEKNGYKQTNDYRAIYKITFPENNYTTELVMFFDKNFRLVDSNFFRTFPDYVLQDRPNDLITKDSALKVAKASGLCLDDILDVDFFRLYDSKEFVWIFRVANKKEREKQRRERSPFGGSEPICRKRVVNAKTGQIL